MTTSAVRCPLHPSLEQLRNPIMTGHVRMMQESQESVSGLPSMSPGELVTMTYFSASTLAREIGELNPLPSDYPA